MTLKKQGPPVLPRLIFCAEWNGFGDAIGDVEEMP
jgi:hypothetical protein